MENHSWPPGVPSKILEEIRKNQAMNKPTDDEWSKLTIILLTAFLVSMVLKYLGTM